MRQVAADARWVTGGASVQKHTELVVLDLVGVATDASEVLL